MRVSYFFFGFILFLFATKSSFAEPDSLFVFQPKQPVAATPAVAAYKIAVEGQLSVYSELSFIDDEFAIMLGGNISITIDKRFLFGGYKRFLINQMKSKLPEYEELRLNYTHGGFIFGYIYRLGTPFLFKRKQKKSIRPLRFEFCFSTQVGYGSVTITHLDRTKSIDKALVITPAIEARYIITPYLRASVGANFGITAGINAFYENGDFTSPAVFVSLQVGSF